MAKQSGSKPDYLYFILSKNQRGDKWTVLQQIALSRSLGDPENNERDVILHYRTTLTREQLDALLSPKAALLGVYTRIFPEPTRRVSASA